MDGGVGRTKDLQQMLVINGKRGKKKQEKRDDNRHCFVSEIKSFVYSHLKCDVANHERKAGMLAYKVLLQPTGKSNS